MDKKTAFRTAAQVLSTASVTPDYKFPRDSLNVYGADGPGGLKGLHRGFVDVADALLEDLEDADAPDGRPTETCRSGAEIPAINEWIGYGCAILTALGGSPQQRINVILLRHLGKRPV